MPGHRDTAPHDDRRHALTFVRYAAGKAATLPVLTSAEQADTDPAAGSFADVLDRYRIIPQ